MSKGIGWIRGEPGVIDNDNVIPFGKYKGETVTNVMMRDPEYWRWLSAQPWVIEKFQSLIVNVTNLAPASEETPTHNAMQVRFLDEEYRYAFVWAVCADLKECVVCEPVFESVSDVVFAVEIGLHEQARMAVEIKPSLGDDFPVVLRQIKKQQERQDALYAVNRGLASDRYSWVLLVGEYSGKGATLEQVCKVFAQSGIVLVTSADIADEDDGKKRTRFGFNVVSHYEDESE